MRPARPTGHVAKPAGAEGRLNLQGKGTELWKSRSQMRAGRCHQQKWDISSEMAESAMLH